MLVSLYEEEPKYYILKSKEAIKIRDERHISKGNDLNDDKMREIVLDDNLLKKYENNWQIIFDYCLKKENE